MIDSSVRALYGDRKGSIRVPVYKEDRIRGNVGDIDPLKKVPSKRARSRVKKGRLFGVSWTQGF